MRGEEFIKSPIFLLWWYKHHFYKLRDTYIRLSDEKLSSAEIKFDDNQISSEFSFHQEKETIQLAVLMRPFLDEKSRLNFQQVWAITKSIFNKYMIKQSIEKIDSSIKRMKRGLFPITVNDKTLDAEGVYNLISETSFFNQKEEFNEFESSFLNIKILEPIYRQTFFNYNTTGFSIIWEIYCMILALENTQLFQDLVKETENENPKCIYCLRTNTKFNSVEHVIPESLGNQTMVLPKGYVCDECNNQILANLDQLFLTYSPIAYMNVLHTPFTKEGELPKANFQNVAIEKKSPTHIVFKEKDKTGGFRNKAPIGDGYVSFSTHTVGKRMDPVTLGRCVYKIGLGIVAFLNVKLDPYDSCLDEARDFVLGKTEGFPNYLLIRTNCQPTVECSVSIKKIDGGSFIELKYYGNHFFFNLEKDPEVLFSYVDDPENFVRFSLLDGKEDRG